MTLTHVDGPAEHPLGPHAERHVKRVEADPGKVVVQLLHARFVRHAVERVSTAAPRLERVRPGGWLAMRMPGGTCPGR